MSPIRALISTLRLSTTLGALASLVWVTSCAKLNSEDESATVRPTVESVSSSTSNGTYGSGESISIQVTFSEAVTVTGSPLLALNSGGTATYASGSGTANLTFSYTIGASDESTDLDYSATTSLTLNGGTVVNSSNVAATLTLPTVGGTGSLGDSKAIVISQSEEEEEASGVTVTSVSSSTANGSYNAGDALSIQVTFSEAVTVDTTGGTPYIVLEMGGTDRNATYASGTGTTSLTFTYTIQAGDTNSDLDYVATTSLSANSGTIVATTGGTTATLTLPAVGGAASIAGQKAIIVDTTAPTVSSVSSSTANGYYNAGDGLSIQVTFSEAVTVATGGGTPYITLEMGGTDRNAAYASGSTTTELTFSHTVQAGDTSSDLNYESTSALSANGGTIQDAAGNTATLTLPALGGGSSIAGQKAIVIDTTAPTVSSVSASSANATYILGQSVTVTVVFTESMSVNTSGGTPYITLETGATDRNATYASTSTTTLSFTYTVQSGDTSSDLDYPLITSLSANSGTIQDLAGNTATLTLPAVAGGNSISDNKNIVVDGVVPEVTNVSSTTANGSYNAGDALAITVTFNQAVTVNTGGGTPYITLEMGGTDRNAAYSAGSTTTVLTFAYTIQAGDTNSDLDYNATSALSANSGTIQDANGNTATLTLPALGGGTSIAGQKAIVVDTTAPTVSNVTASTANGIRVSGQTVSVQVVFTEAVTVDTGGGTPSISLEMGSSDPAVAYASGSTTTTLVFTHTVAAPNYSTDLEYTGIGALVTNSGTIQDAAGNTATLTLPAIGGGNSLSDNKALQIDALTPTVTSIVPKVVRDGTAVTITGTNFTSQSGNATYSLATNGDLFTGLSVSSTSATATVDLGGCGGCTPDDGLMAAQNLTATSANTLTGALASAVRYVANVGFDANFSADGKNSFDSGATDNATGLIVDSVGRTIVVGTDGTKGAISRFTAAGAIDTSFSVDGFAYGAHRGVPAGVAVDSSNNAYLVGTNTDEGIDDEVLIAKYSVTDGSETWGTVQDTGGTDAGYAVKVKSNGNVVVGGVCNSRACVLEFDSNGALNAGFDSDGYTSFGGGPTEIRGIAIQSDLKVVAAGVDGSGDIYVVRLNTDGSLDTTFDTDGIKTVDCGDTEATNSIALDSSEKIYIAAESGTGTCVVRLTTVGALDATWDGDGIKTWATHDVLTNEGSDIAIQQDGKVLVGFRSFSVATNYDIAIYRLTTAGALDTTFDGDGKYTIDIGGNTSDSEVHMALEPSTTGYFNRIHVSSQTAANANDFWVGRIWP